MEGDHGVRDHRLASRRIAAVMFATLAAGMAIAGSGAQASQAAGPSMSSSASSQPTPTPNPFAPKTSAVNHPRGFVPVVNAGHKLKTPATPTTNANPSCSGCIPPLQFALSAPVMGGVTGTPGVVTMTPVYWAPAGYAYTANYKAIINGYLANVALASQQNTNVFSVNTQYYQQANASSPKQHIQYVVQAGAEVDDTTPYPAQNLSPGCVADAGYTDCVSDGDLQAELIAQLAALSLPMDDSHLYLVFFPQRVQTCANSGSSATGQSCSGIIYCAYHSSVAVASSFLLYCNQTFPPLVGCSDALNGSPAPNGDAEADAQISLIKIGRASCRERV